MSNFIKNAVNSATDLQGQKTTENPNPSKSRPATPKIWRVLSKARKALELQVTITNDIKRQCIERQIGSSTLYPDSQMFWSEFMKQAGKLMDSLKYIRDCKNLGVNPMNVAEHIVFKGSKTLNNVLKNGVESTLAKELELYVERFTPTSLDESRNKMLKEAGIEEKK